MFSAFGYDEWDDYQSRASDYYTAMENSLDFLDAENEERNPAAQTQSATTALVPVDNQAVNDSPYAEEMEIDNTPAQANKELTLSKGKKGHGTKRKRKPTVSISAKRVKTVQNQNITFKSIQSLGGSSLPFEEGQFLPWEIIAHCIFPHLSLRDSCSFLFSQKAFLPLLQAPEVLNHLFSNRKIQHVKLSLLVHPLLGSIHTLNLRKSKDSDHQLTQLIQKCSNLTSLALENNKLVDKLINAIVSQSSQLKSLTLINCLNKNLKDQSGFKLFLEKPWALTSLHIKNCWLIDDAVMHALLGNKQELVSFTLEKGSRISDEAIQKVTQDCTNLTALHLDRQFMETSIKILAQNCTNLKSLSLGILSKENCQLLAQRFPKLNQLRFGSLNMPPCLIPDVLANHENLVSLELAGCNFSRAMIGKVEPYYRNLARLTLKNNSGLSDWDFSRLLQSCKNLAYFSLESTALVTEDVIKTLWENCKNLRELHLIKCASIKNINLFENLEPRLSLTKLSLINFSYMEANKAKTPVDIIGTLIKKCPNLTKVNLTGSDQLTDSTMKDLTENCKKLKNLDLTQCKKITNTTIEIIALNSKKIQKVILSLCLNKSIKEEHIEQLVKDGAKRVKIYLYRTGAVTGDCAKSLTEKYPYQVYIKEND